MSVKVVKVSETLPSNPNVAILVAAHDAPSSLLKLISWLRDQVVNLWKGNQII